MTGRTFRGRIPRRLFLRASYRGGFSCMSELPTVTGREAIQAFARAGFIEHHIKGSHHVLKKTGLLFQLTVPVHGKMPLKKGTLRRLIRDAGLTVGEFTDLLQR